MTESSLVIELVAFNSWANDRILAVTCELTAEQQGRELGGSFPTLLTTLQHMAGAEKRWLGRWHGTPRGDPLPGWPPADHAHLERVWRETMAAATTFVESLGDEALARPLDIETVDGVRHRATLGEAIRHVVNHATYHRGQITNMLRQLGVTPVATDLLLYYGARATR